MSTRRARRVLRRTIPERARHLVVRKLSVYCLKACSSLDEGGAEEVRLRSLRVMLLRINSSATPYRFGHRPLDRFMLLRTIRTVRSIGSRCRERFEPAAVCSREPTQCRV